jgi:hypothetical protein
MTTGGGGGGVPTAGFFFEQPVRRTGTSAIAIADRAIVVDQEAINTPR